MVEEKATVTAEPTTPEVNLESELASLKEKLANTEKTFEAAKQEALAEKQNVSKKERQLQEVRSQQGKIEGLEKRLEVVTSMLADIMDKGEYEEEPQPKRKRSEEYLSRIPKPKEPEKPELPEEFVRAASEADVLAKSAGLSVEDSDELAKAYRFFMRGKGDEGLAEVKKVVGERKAKEGTPKKTIDQLTEEDEEEIARKYMEKKGKLHTDAGTPSGKGMTKAEAYAKFAKGELSDEDAKKHELF